MKKAVLVGITALMALIPIACTQVDRAVKGFQAPAGEWQRISEARYDGASDVEYLGASADGAIIVRMPDGRAQIWKR